MRALALAAAIAAVAPRARAEPAAAAGSERAADGAATSGRAADGAATSGRAADGATASERARGVSEAHDVGLAHAGVAAGVALLVVPAAIGGALEATTDDIDLKRGGIYLLTGGLALAPIVSHFVAHEWQRAAVFGALPVAAFVSIVTLLELRPDIFNDGTVATRVTYGAMLCVSAIFSTVGVADSMGAARRARARHRAWSLAPTVGPKGGGLAVGGVF